MSNRPNKQTNEVCQKKRSSDYGAEDALEE